jgi:hypothetical protein
LVSVDWIFFMTLLHFLEACFASLTFIDQKMPYQL